MKRIIAIIALIVVSAISMSAMDAIRIAGVSSSTNVRNVTLTLTVNVYDASNTRLWTSDVPDVYFDNQGVFSFTLNPAELTYNPVYNVKVLNASGGTVLFESRLDKIVLAQSQLGANLDPSEINPDANFIFGGVEVDNGNSRAGIQKASNPTLMMNDVFFLFNQSGDRTFGVAMNGDLMSAGIGIFNDGLTVNNGTTELNSATNINSTLTLNSNAIFNQNVELKNTVDLDNSVNLHNLVIGDFQDGTIATAITPTMPILNIGTLTQIKTLINGVAGQILYVVGNTNGFTLQGVSFTVGATYICTAPNVWVCVGKN
jgi:hypothetical protein